MKVTVFGANGQVGKLVVQQASEKGHMVTAFVRNKAKYSFADSSNVYVVTGDATNLEDVKKAIANANVVISCLGNKKDVLIMHDSHSNILNAAQKLPTKPRCIFISSVGCGGTSWLIKLSLVLIAGKKAFADYEQADARISSETTVPFCLVRPYSLTNKEGKGQYYVTKSQNGTFMRPISRHDVAKFFVDAIETNDWDGKPGVLLGGV